MRDVVYETARNLRKVTSVPIHVDARGGPMPIASDPKLIRQLVWNLVNNAARHAGRMPVSVRISPSESGGVLLSVNDSGSGMGEEDLKKLFTPFATGSSRRSGSGIGMMVTKQIVEAHGGKIMIDSEKGYGTAVLVALPGRWWAPVTKPVALVVDNEKQMTSIVSFALEVQGFDFHTAHNVADAWRILNTYSIDIVVLDVMMPSGSGIDLTHRIRTLSSSIPIILLTALGAEKDRIAGLEAGADDYVTKPFSPRELALRAHAIVRRSNSRSDHDFVEYGSLLIDRTRLVAYWKGRHLDLSDTEVRLLLALSGGDIVSQREILNRAWATTEIVGGREMVKTTIYRLRRQLANLEVEGLEIESHRGLGYSLNVEE